MNRMYPAKLLLFGEYTVLSGSQALAIPIFNWQGKWSQQKKVDSHWVISYAQWLLDQHIITDAQHASILQDHQDGWLYQADIPEGCGAGSSGALVAAWFDRYCEGNKNNITDAAKVMALMESYFHGKSSGMDPLVSWTQQAIVKDSHPQFHAVIDPGIPQGWNLYLLDSQTDRSTSALVHTYQEKFSDPDFASSVTKLLIPVVDHAIHFYLSGSQEMLTTCLQQISSFQRKYFDAMIPLSVQQTWDTLMQLPGVIVKLCGAGGGGFFLIFSTGEADLSAYNLISLHVAASTEPIL